MKISTLLFALSISVASFAQPASEEFPNWTHTDINGVEHTLYDYLDNGQTVVIDIFTTWCPNCVASLPALEDLQETYGEDLKTFSFERDSNTDDEAEWAVEHNVTTPIFDNALATMATWNTNYQPNFFVICPDRTFELKVGSIANDNPLPDWVDACMANNIASLDPNLSVVLQSTVVEDVLRITANRDLLTYRIYSISGQEVKNGQFNGWQEVSVSDLNKGIYLLQVTNGTQLSTLKFVVR